MVIFKALLLLVLIALIAVGAFVYTGWYDIGADAPHWPLVHRVLEIARDRSVAAHARGIQVPNLDDPKLLAEGAEHYNAMCTGCHLAPGMTDSEIRQGLYPQPPNFSEEGIDDPAQAFWAIKHGIKLTAMPAWGATHDDAKVWGMVAFVRSLRGMTPEQYKKLTAGGDAEGGEHHHHHHDGADSDHHDDQGADHPDDHGADRPHDHGAQAPDTKASTGAVAEAREADVRARGSQVMPFALDSTVHVFDKTASGGVQSVVVRAGHADELDHVRAHLRAIAAAFASRDFSGPAHIHGDSMPGLATLKAAKDGELSVTYRERPDGATIEYVGRTDAITAAIHLWFDAQLADHGRDATTGGRPPT